MMSRAAPSPRAVLAACSKPAARLLDASRGGNRLASPGSRGTVTKTTVAPASPFGAAASDGEADDRDGTSWVGLSTHPSREVAVRSWFATAERREEGAPISTTRAAADTGS